MKQIFFETRPVGEAEFRHRAYGKVRAHFDVERKVLVVDLDVFCSCEALEGDQRHLATKHTEAAAIRTAIALFDEWLARAAELARTHFTSPPPPPPGES